jgi:hypothetical protein
MLPIKLGMTACGRKYGLFAHFLKNFNLLRVQHGSPLLTDCMAV